MKTLSNVKGDEAAPFYSDYILLKARLLAESFSFAESLSIIENFLTKFPKSKNAQSAYFLSSFCYENLDKLEEAIGQLKQAIKIDPDSPVGREAGKRLRILEKKSK